MAEVKPSQPPIATPAEKKKRRFPYRKAADLEREIAQAEADLGELEAMLGLPETWKDFEKARDAQERYDTLKAGLEALYAHWEEALEYNA